jgi:hypothetical protein
MRSIPLAERPARGIKIHLTAPGISPYNGWHTKFLGLDLGDPDASKHALFDSDGARIQ